MSDRSVDHAALLPATHVGDLLARIDRGEQRAIDQLLPLVYDELRGYAGKLMEWERPDHTLQRTALVHEVYLKLVKPGASFQSRLHFMNAAAQAMRRILMDHAEARGRLKRGGMNHVKVSLNDTDVTGFEPAANHPPTVDALALQDTLDRLAKAAPRLAQVVMLRFFAGRSETEIAELLSVSVKTVRRDWQAARIWLCDRLTSSGI